MQAPRRQARADATDYNFDYLGARERGGVQEHFQHWRARRETTLTSCLTRLTATRGRHRANVHSQGGSFHRHHVTTSLTLTNFPTLSLDA